MWLFIKILLVFATFGIYLYPFSELVIRGITELSALHLTAGVGGYIIGGIVALLLAYQLLFPENKRISETKLIVKEYSPFSKAEFLLTRDIDNLSKQIYSLKYDLKLSNLSWKIDDLHRDIKDLKRSLKK